MLKLLSSVHKKKALCVPSSDHKYPCVKKHEKKLIPEFEDLSGANISTHICKVSTCEGAAT